MAVSVGNVFIMTMIDCFTIFTKIIGGKTDSVKEQSSTIIRKKCIKKIRAKYRLYKMSTILWFLCHW